jgi:hypothetical protein
MREKFCPEFKKYEFVAKKTAGGEDGSVVSCFILNTHHHLGHLHGIDQREKLQLRCLFQHQLQIARLFKDLLDHL